MDPVQGIQASKVSLPPMPPTSPELTEVTKNGEASFKNLLVEGINQVNSMQQQADQAVEQLVTGEEVDPATVLTSIQKADMSFRMMMQIRNKLMQAYEEIKNMRI
ncbi:MAG: flagellar hook-basal body complex protein FliE [Pirellulaceae bacterium]